MDKFSLDDVSADLDQTARDVMLDVVLSWARYDSLVSQWVMLAYGLSPDAGSLLLGNMDTRTKLERLKSLYEHHNLREGVARIVALQKKHVEYVPIRNAIAHSACGGQSLQDPERVIFAPVKTVKGMLGHMMVEQMHLDGMRSAAKFASDAGDKLLKLTEALLLTPSTPPPEPPLFHPTFQPVSRKKRADRRSRSPRPRGD